MKPTLIERARAVAAGAVSPVDLVEEALDAIERTQPRLNAFTHVFADDAIRRAKELAASDPAGALHGVPVAVKELYDVAGAPTTGCCAAYAARMASSDSVVVERLLAAGAVIIAKTNQHELACGGTGLISSFGPVRNPWSASRMPGGSSSGSGAAVAAGVVAFALGSDSLGSIRHPASWCGVTGLKTTYGAVSMRGAMPFLPSTDSAGPIAVSAADCGLVFRVLADRPPAAARKAIGEMRMGVPQSMLTLVHRDTRRALEAAAAVFEGAGVRVEETAGPDIDGAWEAVVRTLAEFAGCYPDLLDDGRLDPETSFLFRLAGQDKDEKERAIQRARDDFVRSLEGYDAFLAPSTPYPAPAIDADSIEVEGGSLDARSGMARFSAPVNIAGLPAIALPAGFTSEGLPAGIQLIGPHHTEEALVALGTAYQGVTDWHLRAPPD